MSANGIVRKLKKYLCEPRRLMLLLLSTKPARLLPDKAFLKARYRLTFGKKLDLDEPASFSEKLQWLKLYDRKPEYTRMVDKYEAKEYVADIVGDEYIIPTLGVWESFDEIDFSALPEAFVLKCTHDSGGLVMCRDKSAFDEEAARKKIEKCMKNNYFWHCREWPYKDVHPRIIAEQYMEDESLGAGSDCRGLTDYKFFFFNGEPKLLYVSKGLEDHATAGISFYDMDMNEMPYHRSDFKPFHNAVLPDNYSEMKEIACRIADSIDSDFVRIDMYSILGRTYFSEITFSPCGGMIPFEPVSADRDVGALLTLSKA